MNTLNKKFQHIGFLQYEGARKALISAAILMSLSSVAAAAKTVSVEMYDDFGGANYNYSDKWSMPFYGTAGEKLAADGGHLYRNIVNGKFIVEANPFTSSSNIEFLDHIKYLAASNKLFTIPKQGSITFSADITAFTPNAMVDRIMHATKGDGTPTSYKLIPAQQAAVTFHMLNYHETGQLFDWLISGDENEVRASALIERLFMRDPNTGQYVVDRDKAYTQIVQEFTLPPGAHNYAIRYTRWPGEGNDEIEWLIDGQVMVKSHKAGVPLDQQTPGLYKKNPITYPALGPGEAVKDKMNTFIMGHGLFSLLDVFPFNQVNDPALRVNIPTSMQFPNVDNSVYTRLFGQGAVGEFKNFKVETVNRGS